MIGESGPYGPLHKLVPMAGNFQLEVQDPAAMLARVAATPGLRGLLRRACASPPPWHLVVYSDEVSPGNPLGYVGARKTWAVYWSILEFGQAALSSEDVVGKTNSRSHSRASAQSFGREFSKAGMYVYIYGE